MHTIRLRGGWTVAEPSPGIARHTRRFGRPRTLAPNETVWLTIPNPPGPGGVFINDKPVGVIDLTTARFAVEIRAKLLERNILQLDLQAPPDRPTGDVALEIREEPLTLAPARVDDYEFAHELTRTNMLPFVEKYWSEWSEAIFRTNYDRTRNDVLRLGTERVGFVRAEMGDEVLVLEDLQIVPSYQNRGLGRWVLDRVCESAAGLGLRTVRLRSFKDNRARNLYSRADFSVVEDAEFTEWWEKGIASEPFRK
ncbi:MAG TPA: GNAT family N-acetyltransferase [Fimbriiglobus sp.]|jgi:ribosomal protein S18 acetylase RimI-like enzyme